MGGVKIPWGFNLPYRGGQFSIKGFNIPWMKIDPGVNLPWGSKYHTTPGLLYCPCYHSLLQEYVVFLSGSECVQLFYCLFINVLPFEIQLSLSGLTLPLFHACPKPGPGILTSYSMSWSFCAQ